MIITLEPRRCSVHGCPEEPFVGSMQDDGTGFCQSHARFALRHRTPEVRQ